MSNERKGAEHTFGRGAQVLWKGEQLGRRGYKRFPGTEMSVPAGVIANCLTADNVADLPKPNRSYRWGGNVLETRERV